MMHFLAVLKMLMIEAVYEKQRSGQLSQPPVVLCLVAYRRGAVEARPAPVPSSVASRIVDEIHSREEEGRRAVHAKQSRCNPQKLLRKGKLPIRRGDRMLSQAVNLTL